MHRIESIAIGVAARSAALRPPLFLAFAVGLGLVLLVLVAIGLTGGHHPMPPIRPINLPPIGPIRRTCLARSPSSE